MTSSFNHDLLAQNISTVAPCENIFHPFKYQAEKLYIP